MKVISDTFMGNRIALLILAFTLNACSTDKVYHITTSDGVVLYAHVKGQGEPCLYLHGGPGSRSAWMEKMGGKELEKRYTMIYLDQRGVCKSTEPADDNFALKRQTGDFEEVRMNGLTHLTSIRQSVNSRVVIALCFLLTFAEICVRYEMFYQSFIDDLPCGLSVIVC